LLAAKKILQTEVARPIVRENKSKKVSAKPVQKLKISSVMIVLAALVTSIVIVGRYAQISSNHTQIMALERELGSRQDERVLLDLELTSMMDLSRVERIAATELGMRHPNEDQVQYVSLPSVPIGSSDNRVEKQIDEGEYTSLLTKILRLIVP